MNNINLVQNPADVARILRVRRLVTIELDRRDSFVFGLNALLFSFSTNIKKNMLGEGA